MSNEDTVIDSTPHSLNHSPIWADWWVLKWGLNRTLLLNALLAIVSMLRLALSACRTRVGFSIARGLHTRHSFRQGHD
jgi:hypothetical protein